MDTKNLVERAFFSVLGLLTIASLTTIGAKHGLAGLRFNATPSVPMGIYWYSPGPVKRGEFVQACLPAKLAKYAKAKRFITEGVCPYNTEPIVKVLAAIPGDLLVIRRGGLSINGIPWPMSAQRQKDSSGHKVDFLMKPGTYHVAKGYVLLMGLNPRSWDGRYFGFTPTSAVSGRWVSIITE
jgi:conjugative transfer signal peptidase TraF